MEIKIVFLRPLCSNSHFKLISVYIYIYIYTSSCSHATQILTLWSTNIITRCSTSPWNEIEAHLFGGRWYGEEARGQEKMTVARSPVVKRKTTVAKPNKKTTGAKKPVEKHDSGEEVRCQEKTTVARKSVVKK
jgi:hypothetical protein